MSATDAGQCSIFGKEKTVSLLQALAKEMGQAGKIFTSLLTGKYENISISTSEIVLMSCAMFIPFLQNGLRRSKKAANMGEASNRCYYYFNSAVTQLNCI